MFQTALPKTLSHEGYYAFVPGDKGGETYMGIARLFHPTWPGWVIIDRVKLQKGGKLPHNYQIHDVNLNTLVREFYLNKFWTPIRLDEVNDNSLQDFIFDFFVNSGNGGIKVVQSVLRNQFNKNITVDGAMGKQTVAAINESNSEQLFNALKKARIAFFEKIAQKGQNAQFLRGWLKRVNGFNYVGVGISFGIIAAIGIAGFFIYKQMSS